MPKQAISTTPYANQWDWNLLKLVIRRCREKGAKKKVADSTGASLSGTDLLLKSLVLKRIFERDVLDADDKHVGVLLPPTVPAAVTNVALSLGKRVAINLNYTVSDQIVNACIEQAGIKKIITSAKAMEKFGLKPNAKLVYLEEMKDKATQLDKVVSLINAKFVPLHIAKLKFELFERLEIGEQSSLFIGELPQGFLVKLGCDFCFFPLVR